jgi:manganese efflux pump family protein
MLAKTLALILPLGLDTFAVAAALGLAAPSREQRIRISALMTAFEAGMPLLGLAVGAPIGHAIGSAGDYFAAAVLLALGFHMLLVDDRDDEQRLERAARLGGWRAIALGLSISMDELAVGFTFGLLRLPVVPVVALIAAQAFLVSHLGLRLGARLNDRFRARAERLAGLALLLLGGALLTQP